eukprot:4164821-Prorocentrum_lima.AAC.1
MYSERHPTPSSSSTRRGRTAGGEITIISTIKYQELEGTLAHLDTTTGVAGQPRQSISTTHNTHMYDSLRRLKCPNIHNSPHNKHPQQQQPRERNNSR